MPETEREKENENARERPERINAGQQVINESCELDKSGTGPICPDAGRLNKLHLYIVFKKKSTNSTRKCNPLKPCVIFNLKPNRVLKPILFVRTTFYY